MKFWYKFIYTEWLVYIDETVKLGKKKKKTVIFVFSFWKPVFVI